MSAKSSKSLVACVGVLILSSVSAQDLSVGPDVLDVKDSAANIIGKEIEIKSFNQTEQSSSSRLIQSLKETTILYEQRTLLDTADVLVKKIGKVSASAANVTLETINYDAQKKSSLVITEDKLSLKTLTTEPGLSEMTHVNGELTVDPYGVCLYGDRLHLDGNTEIRGTQKVTGYLTAEGGSNLMGNFMAHSVDGRSALAVNEIGVAAFVLDPMGQNQPTSVVITNGALAIAGASVTINGDGVLTMQNLKEEQTQRKAADRNLKAYTDQKFQQLDGRMSKIEHKAYRGIASVAAMANLPMVPYGKTCAVGAAYGYYAGESALAIGANALIRDITVKTSVGLTTGQHVSFGAGVSYAW